MLQRTNVLRAPAALAGVALLAAACGGGGSSAGGVGGSVVVSGSSTVEPISVAVAEKFQADNPDVKVSVDGPGTGDGFELFCNGETDISDASRPIQPEEIEACQGNGIEFIELKIGIDGLSVLTSRENDKIDCLDFHDLYALLGPESEGFDSWADANDLAAELGAAHAPYPDMPLDITAPGEESGTYDSFIEIVLEDIAVEERGQPEDGPFVRPDYQASPNDTVIIEGIAGSPSSLGWVGYAYYVQNQDVVKALEIAEPGGDCVAPTHDTIASGEYPIARDLYIYVNAAKAKENPAVASYVDFYLSDPGIASVEEVGYVAITPEDLQASRAAWEARTTGSQVQS
jgi:phosphate transport system substrate-binding protein